MKREKLYFWALYVLCTPCFGAGKAGEKIIFFGVNWGLVPIISGVYPAFCGNYGARFYDAQIAHRH
jgi:hypothetical protein